MLEKTNAFRFIHVSSYLCMLSWCTNNVESLLFAAVSYNEDLLVDVVRTLVHVAIYQQLVLEASNN